MKLVKKEITKLIELLERDIECSSDIVTNEKVGVGERIAWAEEIVLELNIIKKLR